MSDRASGCCHLPRAAAYTPRLDRPSFAVLGSRAALSRFARGVVRDVERAIRTFCKGHRAMVGICRQVDGALTDEAVRKDLR